MPDTYQIPRPDAANFTLEEYDAPRSDDADLEFFGDIEIFVEREATLTVGRTAVDNDRVSETVRAPSLLAGAMRVDAEGVNLREPTLTTGPVLVDVGRSSSITRSAEWYTGSVAVDSEADHFREALLSVGPAAIDATTTPYRTSTLTVGRVPFDVTATSQAFRTAEWSIGSTVVASRGDLYREADLRVGRVGVDADRTASYARTPTTTITTVAVDADVVPIAIATLQVSPVTVAADRFLFREATVASSTIAIDANRVAEYHREPTTFVSSVSVRPEGYLYRAPAIAADTTSTSSDRTVDLSRDAPIATDAVGINHSRSSQLYRDAAVSTDTIAVDPEGWIYRDPELFVSPVTVTNDRWPVGAWAIDGWQVPGLQSEVRDWEQLELTFRTDKRRLDRSIRPLETEAGSYDVLEMPDGSFEAVDRAGGENTVRLDAPFADRDVRYMTDYVVDEVSDEVIDQGGERYEAVTTFQAAGSKTPQDDYGSAEPDDDEWLFEFDSGAFATRRVRHDIGNEGAGGVETTLLTLELDDRQTQILEETASRLDAVKIRNVPDGSNYVVDVAETNTVELTVPDEIEDKVPSGSYALMEWTTDHYVGDVFYTAEVEISSLRED